LQYILLPADFLKHFGYGPGTIPASATIDQKVSYPRVQSTLRGPNPLGAYLVLVLSAVGAMIVAARKFRWRAVVLYAVSGVALVLTFSRSAWLGALVSMILLIWLSLRSVRIRRYVLLAAAVAVTAFAIVGYALRDNDRFQNIFFHTNEQSQSTESSNQGHLAALHDGVSDVLHRPWGDGTGTAGPASVYNTGGSVRIAENYYVQIAQETGVIGLALFVAINVLVVLRLWQRRGDQLALVLLVSFAGIAVINMLMHAWSDDTLAYIWWGLAGAAVAAPGAGKKVN
jgi:O-antigen ligase